MNMQFNPSTKKRKWFSRKTGLFVATLATLGIFFIIRHIAFSQPVYGDVASNFLESKHSLVTQITALKTVEEKIQSDAAMLALLTDENAKLKAELGRQGHPRGTLATVLFPPGRSLYNTFVIDAGTSEGIREGQLVFAFDSVALGTVSEVDEHRATVLLYSESGRETAGTVVGTDTAITLIGRGGGEYEVRMPRDVHFEVGQTVALQSTEPRVFATIQKISTDPRDPFQRLLAKAPINLQNLKWVVVE